MLPPLFERSSRARASRRGASLVVAVLFMMILGGMAASLTVLNVTFHQEHELTHQETCSFYTAEAGLNEALAVLTERGKTEVQALSYPRTLGKSTYSVEVVFGEDDPALRADRVRIRSVGEAGRTPVGVELMLEKVATGDFAAAVTGAESVLLESGCMIDSWDSTGGAYPAFVPYAESAGNVVSNGDVVIQTNVAVHGDVMAGPTGTVDDSATGITIDGQVGMSETLVGFPVIVVPSFPDLGPLVVSGGTTTLAAGDYDYSSVSIASGTLEIQGPARVVLGPTTMESTGQLVIDATGGPVEIYATSDFDLRENSVITVTTPRPRDVALLVTASNLDGGTDTIILDSDGDFQGTIYAPDALIDVDNEFHVYGAVKARRVQVEFDGAVHYDEDLLYDPGLDPVYQRASWRRLSAAEARALGT